MSQESGSVTFNPSLQATEAKKELNSSFFKKGVTVALLSGISYGLYTTFMTLAMTKGVWADWYGANTAGLSAFAITFVIATLGSAVNDIMSAIWAFLQALRQGKVMDFFRTIPTKPGLIMILAALIGGPIASAAYVIALQMAGSIVIPIAALNTAIGAILGKVLLGQDLNKRQVLGIVICVAASMLIGLSGSSGDAGQNTTKGILIALIAALGWGLEGCVGGYATSMVDNNIGIVIRQTTSGVFNLLVLTPIMATIEGGGISLSNKLISSAFTSLEPMIFFAISGFCSLYAYSLWYKGNSMCGAALGMALNGTYSFWGPFFCFLILGVFLGHPGWDLAPAVWIGAVMMAIGIFVIALNPLDFFRKKKEKDKQ